MATMKMPSGLAIARDGNKFVCTWKHGKNYDSVVFQGKTSDKTWSNATTETYGTTRKQKTLTVNFSNYYPYTSKYLSEVAFRLSVKYTYTDPVVHRTEKLKSSPVSKSFAIKIPPKSSPITVTPDENNNNKCTFGWSVSPDTHQVFTNVEWQSWLAPSTNTTDGSNLAWKSTNPRWSSGTGSATGTQVFTEQLTDIASGSHTRLFRVRARGPAGASPWVYGKRVYAAPYAANVTSATLTTKPAGGAQVVADFTAQYSNAYPIDYVVIEYTVDKPAAGLVTPSGSSWTTATQYAINKETNKVSFPMSDTIGPDEALFMRVNTVHLDKTTDGKPFVVKYGSLSQPTDLSASVNDTTHKATITATNESDVPGAMLAVCYRAASNPSTHTVIGIIENGSSSISNVQCPNWDNESWYKFGVYAFCGTYKSTPRADSVSSYAITKTTMRSEGVLWQTGTMPVAPSNVSVELTDLPGTVKLTWRWAGAAATFAELSWADHADAWMSTDEPEKYTVTAMNASEWNISGLETGKRWYFRVRLGSEDDIYSPWSDPVDIVPSSAPAVPVLNLSEGVIEADGSVAASWVYVSTDGTNQASADLAIATQTGGSWTYSSPFEHAEAEQNITLYAEDYGWTTGNTYNIAVRVISESGRPSEWSEPCPLIIADPLQAVIASDSLTDITITDAADSSSRTVLSLTAMPLTATITGAGAGGTTMLTIERAADYHVDRPDETTFNGFEGETIAQVTQTGEAAITVSTETLYGTLDDGAQYRLIATVKDGLGRASTVTKDFEVHWSHQAVMPQASVLMLGTAAKITPTKPTGWASGDTCDIYRLSADKPQLIVKGAEFDTAYVDPYPAIGENGGHRIVYRTADGDYITANDEMAFLDLRETEGDRLDAVYSLVDFDGGQIQLLYD